MKKKIIVLLWFCTMTSTVLIGCNSNQEPASDSGKNSNVVTESELAESEDIINNDSDIMNTSKEYDVAIYENDYFEVTLNYISLHEAGFTVTNKTDVNFTLTVSDLVLDGISYGSSERCDEISSGDSGEMIYYTESEELNISPATISGTFSFIDDGGLYGYNQEEIIFEEVDIN